MASINQMIEAAEKAGFVRTECVHPHKKGQRHVVLDYPEPLGNGTTGPFWRIHTDPNKVPHQTYISGSGPDHQQRRVSLVVAIIWAQRIASENPKT
jgi:hypothetical protein